MGSKCSSRLREFVALPLGHLLATTDFIALSSDNLASTKSQHLDALKNIPEIPV